MQSTVRFQSVYSVMQLNIDNFVHHSFLTSDVQMCAINMDLNDNNPLLVVHLYSNKARAQIDNPSSKRSSSAIISKVHNTLLNKNGMSALRTVIQEAGFSKAAALNLQVNVCSDNNLLDEICVMFNANALANEARSMLAAQQLQQPC